MRVGVVGAGQMGAGIAEVCARAGLDVMVRETTPVTADIARQRIEGSLARTARKGKLTDDTHDRAVSRLSYTSDLDALADRGRRHPRLGLSDQYTKSMNSCTGQLL